MKVLIHCKESYKQGLKDLGQFFTLGDGELDVIVDDVPYNPELSFIDPDVQLCNHYNIDYDQVNCIEAL